MVLYLFGVERRKLFSFCFRNLKCSVIVLKLLCSFLKLDIFGIVGCYCFGFQVAVPGKPVVCALMIQVDVIRLPLLIDFK